MEQNKLYTKNIELLSKTQNFLAKEIENSKEIDSIYTKEEISKTNVKIATFTDGKTMYSKYNPLEDAKRFCVDSKDAFYVVLGLGNGYHLESILKNQNAELLIVEKNPASYKTLFNQNDFSCLLKNRKVHFCTVQTLSDSICNFYLPQICGDFVHLANRAWLNFNENVKNFIFDSIQEAIKKISLDFSVQSHFGKVWFKNIIRNYKTLFENSQNFLPQKIDTNKKVAIIGAAPSLDFSIEKLKKEKNETFIIATDTASLILSEHKIIPDLIISIDGQNISYRHFIDSVPSKKTIYALDISSHPAIAEKIAKNGNPIVFFLSNHPLGIYINNFINNHATFNIPQVDTTSGTVTVAALDLAIKMGFETIELYGADFAYTHSKPYAKSSYLDRTFSLTENRFLPLETSFTKLMYRTEVFKRDKSTVVSEILEHYENELLNFLHKNKPNIRLFKILEEEEKLIYEKNIQTKPTNKNIFFQQRLKNAIKYADVVIWLLKKLNEAKNCENPDVKTVLLPLAAFYKTNSFYKDKISSFNALIDLAQDMIERYSGVKYDQ